MKRKFFKETDIAVLKQYLDTNPLLKVSFAGTDDANYQAQLGVKVDDNIVNMHPAQDAFNARLRSSDRENGQLSAVFTTLDEINFLTASDPFFQEGLCPPGVEESKTQDAIPKKHFGVENGITNAAIAAMNNRCNAQGIDGRLMDEVERKLMVLDISYRNSLDWGMINGDVTVSALQFDGLDQLTVASSGSLVIDLGGTAITRADINQVISVQLLRGVTVTGILSNPLMINHIQEIYHVKGDECGSCVPTSPVDNQPNPYQYIKVPTPAGMVDLVGDVHISVSHTGGGTADDYTSTVFVITEDHNGEDLLYMDYLIPQSMLPDYVFHDGSHCTSQGFGMYAVGALVSRAPVAQSKFINAGFSSSGDLYSTIVSLSSKVV